jgi:CubicO group peptidase (beta-lactamase class C family)
VTLRRILDHTAGFPAFPAAASSLAPTDGEALLDSLWAAGPETPPGEVLAEHALTYGHLIDGVLAAVEAPSIRMCARELATELGCQFEFGLSSDQQHRSADLTIIDPEWADPYLSHELGRRALACPPGLLNPSTLNSPSYRATSFPAIGLQTNASSLAAFYNDLANPDGHVETRLGHEIHREYLSAQATGFDEFLHENATWSLGFRLDDEEIGMGGMGGSAGWHSPRLNYSMAYTTRGLGTFDRLEQLATIAESIITG